MFINKTTDFFSDRAYRKALVSRSVQPIGWTLVIGLMFVACIGGDFANLYQTVESLLGGSGDGWLILLIAVFGTTVAVAVPPFFARYAKDRHVGVPGRPIWVLIALGVAWLGVVVAVTYVRVINEVGADRASAAKPSSGIGGTSANLHVAGSGMAMTAVMTSLLAATAALGVYISWTQHDPHLEGLRRAERAHAKVATYVMALTGLLPQFAQAAADAHAEPEREQRRFEAALARVDAIEGRYREIVREEIAKRLEDPGATSGLLPGPDEQRQEPDDGQPSLAVA